MARTAGWITQWREMISDPEQKIGRPRQLFLGSQARDVTPKIENETQAS
jgi:citrate synthase